MASTTKSNRRYYLHRKLKEKAIRYNPFKKTIYIYFDDTSNDPHIGFLKSEYDYSVQFEIK